MYNLANIQTQINKGTPSTPLNLHSIQDNRQMQKQYNRNFY